MTDQPPKRTAAATAAWRRRAEERKAGELRARGWTVIPPEDTPAAAGRLVATVRRAPDRPAVAWLLVNVRDAAGQLVASFTTPGVIPANVTRLEALNQVAGALSVQGFHVSTCWTVGTDDAGRVATAQVTRVATHSHSVSDQGR